MKTLHSHRGRLLVALLATWLHCAQSAPAALEGGMDAEPAAPAILRADAEDALSDWVETEGAQAALSEQHRRTQQDLGRQPFAPKPRSWVEAAAAVNPADFPALDKSLANAERDLQTIEWLRKTREERELQGQQARGPAGDSAATTEKNSTLLDLLKLVMPGHLIPFLKEHRVLILGGAGLVLAVSWLLAASARRPAWAARGRASDGEAAAGPFADRRPQAQAAPMGAAAAVALGDAAQPIRRRRHHHRRRL